MGRLVGPILNGQIGMKTCLWPKLVKRWSFTRWDQTQCRRSCSLWPCLTALNIGKMKSTCQCWIGGVQDIDFSFREKTCIHPMHEKPIWLVFLTTWHAPIGWMHYICCIHTVDWPHSTCLLVNDVTSMDMNVLCGYTTVVYQRPSTWLHETSPVVFKSLMWNSKPFYPEKEKQKN